MFIQLSNFMNHDILFLLIEHFIVWMRTAGLPNFRKLWGTITDDLPAGEYTLKIEDNYEV